MTKLKMTAALFSLATMTGPALAQDFVDAKVQELFAQGYTHFEISRGFLQTEIEAYGPNFTKREVRLSNANGLVVSERTQIESPAEYTENVQEISPMNTNVREDSDDDGAEAHRDGVDDDHDEGVNDDRDEGDDDDHYNDHDDGYESRDDGRDDDHDDDRDGERDNDGHDSDGHYDEDD
jgi:hypothetical protein